MTRFIFSEIDTEGAALSAPADNAGRITTRLLSAAEEVWEGYHSHPFVRGIAEGTLDQEKFRFYMLQDYVYLLEYVRVFAVGLAKAECAEVMAYFAGAVRQITDGEMEIHRAYMKRLGISESEAEQTRPALDNSSYTSYMLRVAYEGSAAEAAAAILSCALSYEVIARRVVKEHPEAAEHPFYGEWVRGYSGREYHEENTRLIALTEQLTAEYGEAQLAKLEEIFVNCSRFESAFWDMAWECRL